MLKDIFSRNSMDVDNAISEGRHFTERRHKLFSSASATPLVLLGSQLGVINEQPDTTPLVITALQRAAPPPLTKNERCRNAFVSLMSYTVGIGSLFLGCTYINGCPYQKMLPIGLIIFGGILVVGRLLNCVYDCRSIFNEYDFEDTPLCIQTLNVIFILASFGTFIAVCYWTYFLTPTTKTEDHGLKNYCDSTLVHIANWGCIIGIFFAVPCLYGGCASIYYARCSS